MKGTSAEIPAGPPRVFCEGVSEETLTEILKEMQRGTRGGIRRKVCRRNHLRAKSECFRGDMQYLAWIPWRNR